MKRIRIANERDIGRIAEIEVFNYRLNFYPIFRHDEFYFDELTVTVKIAEYRDLLDSFRVYDDGVVKGFVQIEGQEIRKLFVEPVLQGQGIGAALLEHAVSKENAQSLWALEKNARAIAFYQRHGFRLTDERKPEDDTDEYLVRLERSAP